jgi:hypothetical protein
MLENNPYEAYLRLLGLLPEEGVQERTVEASVDTLTIILFSALDIRLCVADGGGPERRRAL